MQQRKPPQAKRNPHIIFSFFCCGLTKPAMKLTLEDVASMSTQTSGYIVIDNKVYEITDYMLKHP